MPKFFQREWRSLILLILAAFGGAAFVYASCVSHVLFDELRSGKISRTEHAVYHWRSAFWVKDAAIANIERHRALIKLMRENEATGRIGDFAITGHRLHSGKGAVLGIRTSSYNPHRQLAEKKRSYKKLTIFLPEGLPTGGVPVYFGESARDAPLAFWSEGEPLVNHPGKTCFGYATKGMLQIVKLPKSFSSNVSGRNQEGGTGGKARVGLAPTTDLLIANLSMTFEPFREDKVDGLVPCGYFSLAPDYKRSWAGLVDQISFVDMEIGNLQTWQGLADGPVTYDEFGPSALLD